MRSRTRSASMSTNRMVRPQPKAVQLHGADLGQHLDQPVLHDLKAHQGLAELRLATPGSLRERLPHRCGCHHLPAQGGMAASPGTVHLRCPPRPAPHAAARHPEDPLARFAYECGLACSLRTSSATASPVPVGALQDRHLVPQRKGLHILVAVAHRQQAYERERVRQGEIGQSQHGRSSSPKGSGPAVRVSS